MKRIPLTQGRFAIIDDDDLERVSEHKWYFSPRKIGHGYACKDFYINGKRQHTYMHRYILGSYGGKVVDHINGNSLDNRKSNLRLCSHQENMHNHKKPYTNKSGYKGVYLYKKDRYISYIKVNYKTIRIGIFTDKLSAARAYNIAASKYFGEYARLNDV